MNHARTLDRLATVFDSLPEKLVVSLAVVTIVAVGGSLARRLRDQEPEHVSPSWVHLGLLVGGIVAVLGGFLVIVGVWGLGEQLSRLVGEYTVGTEVVGNALLSGIILVTAYALTNFLGRLIQAITAPHWELSEHQREVIYRLTQIAIYVAASIVVLGVWDLKLGGLLIGAGFLGIVVGMAARQTLAAVLAGLVLMFSRPFEIGDWVEVGEHEGTVTDITIFNTYIQTFDGEFVVVPNDVISGESIVNRSRKGRLRIQVEVGVDYQDDPERASDLAVEEMREIETVLDVPSPQAVLKRFGDSSVVLGLRFWIDNPSARRKWRTQTQVVQAVKTRFEEEGIKIPFPQREVTNRPEAGGITLSGGGDLADGHADTQEGER